MVYLYYVVIKCYIVCQVKVIIFMFYSFIGLICNIRDISLLKKKKKTAFVCIFCIFSAN